VTRGRIDVTDNDDVYEDSGYHLASFADEVWCSCPACGQLAIVRAQCSAGPAVEAARIVCRHCPFTRDWTKDAWIGPAIGIASGLCHVCGTPLEKELRRKRFRHGLPDTAMIRCRRCDRYTTVKLSWRKPYGDAPLDPYFSLPLHLKIDCAHGELWAYNPRHLEELLLFARARIRRRAHGRELSMIARLPRWAKAANNRDDVIHCLEALREEVRLAGEGSEASIP
jgi:hypothetical protein